VPFFGLAIYSLVILVNPAVNSADEIMFEDITKGAFYFTVEDKNRYIINSMNEDEFEDSREYLYAIFQDGHGGYLRKLLIQAVSYSALFILTLFFHVRIYLLIKRLGF